MPIISRKTQKIFAQNATNNGQFGSAQLGTKVLSSDLATLQALPAFSNGWNSATMSAKKLPTLEEFQALHYITTSQIAYLFQEGIAEYDSGTEYRINSLVKKSGTAQIYKSLTDANIGNALTDNTKWALTLDNATTTTQGITFLNSPITIANNATTPNTKIDFLAGNAQLNDGSGQVLLSSALTKILQSTGAWTAGNDANGLFSGARANNTWYYAFAIQNTTTNAVDAGFDSSPTGANVPSGWKITKLIHCFRTNASGNILAGTYFKDKTFSYNSSILEETATNATVAGNLTLSYVPPVPAYAINLAYANNNAANAYAYYVAGTSSSNIYWETPKLNAGYGRANGVIPTNNAVIYRSYGGDQARTCELYTNGFKLID